MPIAHLLELWKGIEVEPMETEVSGRRPPLPPPGEMGCDGGSPPPPLATGGSAREPVAPQPEWFGAGGGERVGVRVGSGVRGLGRLEPRKAGAGLRCVEPAGDAAPR